MSHAELATSYAALILADDDVDITVSRRLLEVQLSCGWVALTFSPQPDKLQTLIKAANVEDVEPIWTTLYAKVRRTISELDLAIAYQLPRPLKERMSRTCY